MHARRMRSFTAFLILSLSASAAVAWPGCSTSQFAWSLVNSTDVCDQAGLLLERCDFSASIDAYWNASAASYAPPSGDDATSCACSAVVYNLISACAACQDEKTCGAWPTWSKWIAACSTSSLSFPHVYPESYTPPVWAFVSPNSTGDGAWSFGLSYALSAGHLALGSDGRVSVISKRCDDCEGGAGGTQDDLDDCEHDLGIYFPLAIAFIILAGLLLALLALLFLRGGEQINETFVWPPAFVSYPPTAEASRSPTPPPPPPPCPAPAPAPPSICPRPAPAPAPPPKPTPPRPQPSPPACYSYCAPLQPPRPPVFKQLPTYFPPPQGADRYPTCDPRGSVAWPKW